ncbi:chromate transporter [Alkalispirochaeta americana]|uniref:Chromate transporter n=1 Tax=Alkalispirochaeta americana TaxID=159291 RepID=A0A1N6UW65_9SPIO|nr:chromate transporter [Alkalispirochaeta americana]SIQ69884.1 chromate transporter [Alkalispirochaeta americana]
MNLLVLLGQLFFSFFSVGWVSFGGGQAILPIIQSVVVTNRGWLSTGEFVDLIAISQITPGPVAINTATFVGYRIAGVPGAVSATVGLVIPPVIVSSVLCLLMRRHRDTPVVAGMQAALKPALIALILYSAMVVAQVAFTGYATVLVAVAGLVVLLRSGLHPLWVIVASAGAGVLLGL